MKAEREMLMLELENAKKHVRKVKADTSRVRTEIVKNKPKFMDVQQKLDTTTRTRNNITATLKTKKLGDGTSIKELSKMIDGDVGDVDIKTVVNTRHKMARDVVVRLAKTLAHEEIIVNGLKAELNMWVNKYIRKRD